MTNIHTEQIIKMAQQMALKMAADGDAQAEKRVAHIQKFWTPGRRQQLVDYSRAGYGDMPPAVAQAVDIIGEAS